MDDELDEVIDLIFTTIHNYIESKLKDKLNEDSISIDIDQNELGEVEVGIEIYVESFPYNKVDLQTIVDQAILQGISVADQKCPSLVVKAKSTFLNK